MRIGAQVEVWDSDTVGDDDSLGSTTLPPSQVGCETDPGYASPSEATSKPARALLISTLQYGGGSQRLASSVARYQMLFRQLCINTSTPESGAAASRSQ